MATTLAVRPLSASGDGVKRVVRRVGRRIGRKARDTALHRPISCGPIRQEAEVVGGLDGRLPTSKGRM